MSRHCVFPRRWLVVSPDASARSRAAVRNAEVDALIVAGPVRDAAPFLASAREYGARARLFCAVPSGDMATPDDDLDVLGATPPDGVLLMSCRGRADLQQVSIRLALVEARAGVEAGSIKIIASVAQTPDAVFGLGGLAGASRRLAGLVFDPGALPRAMGPGFDPSGAAAGTARGLVVFAAAAAGVPALVVIPPHLAAASGAFEAFCVSMRGEGFAGAIGADPDQTSRIAAIFGCDPV